MIKYFIDGTHKFTKNSIIIQILFWLNCIFLYFEARYLFIDGWLSLIVLLQIILMWLSPFIALIFNITSVFLDKKKVFSIVLLIGNIVLVALVVFAFILSLQFSGFAD